ncbi:MAG: MT-A70 family methyltransferase [Magnetospirillum sp.]|nr:MT-A70 family methyltransferase [Magnetospirillum sp.]
MNGELFPDIDRSPASRTGYASPVAWRSWPFGDLAPASFGMIMADPPWAYRMRGKTGYGKSPQAHYDCIDIDDLCALPVDRLAATDCLLFMWTTWPFLANGAAHKLIKAWGFEPKTGFPWKKLTKKGKIAFATGYILRSCTEVVIVAVRGAPAYDDFYRARTRGLIEAQAREHSRKPDCVYEMAERLVPAARRLDLFARERRAGWSAWGNETTKFQPPVPTPANPYQPLPTTRALACEAASRPDDSVAANRSRESAAASPVSCSVSLPSDDDLLEIPRFLKRGPDGRLLYPQDTAPAGRVFP